MVQVTAEEAQNHLPDLIAKAMSGETVVITQDGQQSVQLVPVAQGNNRRQAGSAKGMIWIADDFDAPLEDFKEYMSDEITASLVQIMTKSSAPSLNKG